MRGALTGRAVHLGWFLVALLVIALMRGELIPVYHHYSVMLVCIYGIVVLSVSLLASWAGVWSVGHTTMLAMGAYTAAYGSSHGWSLEQVLVVAVVMSAAAGAFLGFAGARFSVLYIALLTLIFNLVALEVINRWSNVTGGDEGVSVGSLRSITGFELMPGSDEVFTLVVFAFAATLAAAGLLRGSSLRMRMQAAKSHPTAARTSGISPPAQTSLAFATSAAFAGFAGVLLGLCNGYVSPEVASLHFSTNVVAAAVLGGVGTLLGGVVGGLYLAFASALAAALGIPQLALQGAILVVVLVLLPEGVVTLLGQHARRLAERLGWRGFSAWHARSVSPAEVVEPDRTSAGRPAGDSEALTFHAVGVQFGGLTALRDITFGLRRGEVLGIVGPNGSGKTTLLNAASGLLPRRVQTGAIATDTTALHPGGAVRRSRLGIGRTFQHAELFADLTVIEHILCTRRFVSRGRRAEAEQLLRRLGLDKVAHARLRDLSFGVQKRVDLARALAERPSVLLMDEPFGGLDHDERRLIVAAIDDLRREGVSILVIDHVLEELTTVADRMVALDYGRQLASGDPAVVLRDEQVRAAYLGAAEGDTRAVSSLADREVVVGVTDVSFSYGGVEAVRDLSLQVHRGCVVAVVGANGAGKSTVGKLLHGSLRPDTGTRTTRSDGAGDDAAVRISLVPEGRGLFRTLSIRENLEVSAYAAGLGRREVRQRLDEAMFWLPERLRGRQDAKAALLSGGEQQMVAFARALMADPEVIILDEPALGLSPTLAKDVYARIFDLAASGRTIVLLEQSLPRALAAADVVYVLLDGRVVAVGSREEEGFEALAEEKYFGGPEPEVLVG